MVRQRLERVSLIMLVGVVLFEIVTGVLIIKYDYIFGFSFYTAHYFGAWVFITGFVMHIAIKIPRMVTGLRSVSLRKVLRTKTSDTRPESADPDGLVAANPADPTISRRGALALVGVGTLLMTVLTGQTVGRAMASHAARGRVSGGAGPRHVAEHAAAQRTVTDRVR